MEGGDGGDFSMKMIFFVMLAVFAVALIFAFPSVFAAEEGGAAEAAMDRGLIALGTSISIAGAAIGAGIAIASTGPAATGATAEKPELFGRVLIFVALAEAIAIYGFLVAIFLWLKI